MKNNKILITGGAGFIGRNLVECFKGHEITVLDLFPRNNENEFKELGIETIKGDICKKEDVEKAVSDATYVIHLAALTDVIESIKKPEIYFKTNTEGTLNLLKTAKKENVKKLIFTSSVAVLGDQELPINEEQEPKPISPYGKSKLKAENHCMNFNSKNLKVTVIRPTNVYGPHSMHKTDAISKFIRNILKDEPIKIYGDGEQTRDFVYVRDICSAINLCLKKDIGGEIFHIGTGTETSVNELINTLKSVSGKDIKLKKLPAREGEIIRNYTSIEKAEELLGYEPKVSLGEGLKQTYGWFKEKINSTLT